MIYVNNILKLITLTNKQRSVLRLSINKIPQSIIFILVEISKDLKNLFFP